jgi:hypothetical protein
MKPPSPRRLWLALPPFLICLLDHIFTLAGQDASYWAGNYALVSEGAPHGKWLLMRHPAFYIVAACFHLAIIVVGLLLLPRLLARIAAACVVIGHTWGTSFWIYDFFPEKEFPGRAYWLCLVLFVLSGTMLVLGFEMSEGGLRRERPGTPGTP